MAPPITRVVLFKIASPADQAKLFEYYRPLAATATKDGKPYILSARAGPTFEDQRRQGFTVAAVTEFKNEEDMKYYDEGCETHAELKKFAKSVHEGAMMVYFRDVLAP
ncbi:uncharacterized protein CC84DRAFT_1161658 [Paraphaeosphaeria sporulosa]|uniref:Stress-response A/B barrel domain-containing protein n=1 Tax=Paraphaeosphaeria sporulosa TaxID=1460663 RepID=A0A177CUW5_9PLEO|nr:uncharacterized protein CC84DRAFT_1161658 [Paraphaeosphaeria sporulosa]OAG10808.1 hypothetical protein CC84DRAFT_1161658 [Paraphaeosphaeria sporulosa]